MRKDIIKLLELFVYKNGVLVKVAFSSAEWEKVYMKNSLYNSDHILDFALNSGNNFFIWNHLASTPTEKIVYNKRCKKNKIKNGLSVVYKHGDHKVICMFSLNKVNTEVEKYISDNYHFFKTLINNIRCFYVEGGRDELWKNISRTYQLN